MEFSEILAAVNQVAFPIACCCFLLWQNSKQDAYNREEQAKLRDIIEKNTESITKLAEKIDAIMK